MSIRMLESHRGVGNLYSGDKLVLEDVEYEFALWQQMVSARRGEEIPGLKDAAGRLLGVDNWALIDIMGGDPMMVLVLEDGRKWPCLLSDSSTGRLRGRGVLLAA